MLARDTEEGEVGNRVLGCIVHCLRPSVPRVEKRFQQRPNVCQNRARNAGWWSGTNLRQDDLALKRYGIYPKLCLFQDSHL
jgi:hypothetical protein